MRWGVPSLRRWSSECCRCVAVVRGLGRSRASTRPRSLSCSPNQSSPAARGRPGQRPRPATNEGQSPSSHLLSRAPAVTVPMCRPPHAVYAQEMCWSSNATTLSHANSRRRSAIIQQGSRGQVGSLSQYGMAATSRGARTTSRTAPPAPMSSVAAAAAAAPRGSPSRARAIAPNIAPTRTGKYNHRIQYKTAARSTPKFRESRPTPIVTTTVTATSAAATNAPRGSGRRTVSPTMAPHAAMISKLQGQ